MSADVWDFAEAGAGVDCGRKARDYQGGGRAEDSARNGERDLRAKKWRGMTWWWELRRAGRRRMCWGR